MEFTHELNWDPVIVYEYISLLSLPEQALLQKSIASVNERVPPQTPEFMLAPTHNARALLRTVGHASALTVKTTNRYAVAIHRAHDATPLIGSLWIYTCKQQFQLREGCLGTPGRQ
jgi:hypothetical protein